MKPYVSNLRNPARRYILLAAMLMAFALLHTCEKHPRIVLLNTGTIDTIQYESAEITGEIIDPGKGITQHGHCWAQSPQDPTVELETKTTKGQTDEPSRYTSSLNQLVPGKDYNVRAYAIVEGESPHYGESTSLTTLEQIGPEVETKEVTHFSQTTAIVGGVITSSGGADILERGIYWSSSEDPGSTGQKQQINSGSDDFEYELTGLSPGTLYYVEAYAINTIEPGFGGVVTFETPGTGTDIPPVADFEANRTHIPVNESVTFIDRSFNSPTSWSWTFGDGGTSTDQNPTHTYTETGTFTVTLTASNSYGSNEATKTGYITVDPGGEPPVADFEANKTHITENESVTFIDQSANFPTSWSWTFGDGGTSTDQNPTHTYTEKGTFTVILTATNSYGSDEVTKTEYITVDPGGEPPVADFEANKTRLRENESVTFTDLSENGPTSWSWTFGDGGTSPEQNPSYTYATAGKYTVTLVASNDYGNDEETKTDYITVVVVDVEENEYEAKKIGNQTWMTENLKTKHFNSGASIPMVSDETTWSNLSTPAYCWNENNEDAYHDLYGPLYNWYVVETESICPSGWHVPSDNDWKILEMYSGMSQADADGILFRGSNEGYKLKAVSGWISGGNGSDLYLFSALPGGYRGKTGDFGGIGSTGMWWSSSQYSTTHGYYRYLENDHDDMGRYYLQKNIGMSIRCVKD